MIHSNIDVYYCHVCIQYVYILYAEHQACIHVCIQAWCLGGGHMVYGSMRPGRGVCV